MSNVFSIKEAENRDVLIPITASGVERLLKKGARIKFRDDLEEGKNYGGIHLIEEMAVMKGKEATIEKRDDDSIYIKGNDNYIYPFEMLEGVYLN